MTIEDLVHFAELDALTSDVIEQTCAHEHFSVHEAYNAFAKDVHEKYLKGIYSWGFCDGAINSLYAYAYIFSDTCLPAYAREVYLAFDAGEFIHAGDPPNFDGEIRTKALLAKIVEKENA